MKADLDNYGIGKNLSELKAVKRAKYKEMIKERTRQLAFLNLMKSKESHTKMKNVHYCELKFQDYLRCTEMSVNQARVIFRTRCRMTIYWDNFKGWNMTQNCPVCREHDTLDDQGHSFLCKVILDNVVVEGTLEQSYREDIRAEVARSIERIEKFRENYL